MRRRRILRRCFSRPWHSTVSLTFIQCCTEPLWLELLLSSLKVRINAMDALLTDCLPSILFPRIFQYLCRRIVCLLQMIDEGYRKRRKKWHWASSSLGAGGPWLSCCDVSLLAYWPGTSRPATLSSLIWETCYSTQRQQRRIKHIGILKRSVSEVKGAVGQVLIVWICLALHSRPSTTAVTRCGRHQLRYLR